MDDWYLQARRVLKTELVRRDIGYKKLALLLEQINVEETQRSIANKLSRGSFSFAFFLQCMKAIGATRIDLE